MQLIYKKRSFATFIFEFILHLLKPTVSIVILNWNGRAYLEKFLPGLIAGTAGSAELVVIDNASTDDSVDFLRANYPFIKIIFNKNNFGFARGYNEGLKQVEADYYVLLNSDVEVKAGWLAPLIKLMESDPQIGACQPKILQQAEPGLFEYAGAAGGWLDYLGYPFARGRIFDFCEEDQGQYDDALPVFWASGAALVIRSKIFWELGGFDGYFFAHQEEIDLCWRLQLAGYLVYVCPESVVYHVGGGTLPKGNALKVFLNFRNNLIMMAKNMPMGEAFIKIFLRFWLDGISAFKSLFSGEGTYFVAVVKAHLAFLYWLFFVRKRSVFPAQKGAPLSGYWKKSVVWAHFIRGKKKFSEIIEKKN